MNIYTKWLEQNPGGRKRLFAALKTVKPNISHGALTNYIRGARKPSKELAKAIAETMGIPLSQIPYRTEFVNTPDSQG